MEFQTTTFDTPPKNLYPCLATITVVPHGTDTKSRRLSTSSNVSGGGDGSSAVADEDGNALRRIISGGRRRTSFGVVADRGDLADGGRRRSFSGGPGSGGGEEITGKWYWRVQAGSTDHHLVLLPLSQPPNPVLTTQPQPLSHAMPAHSKTASNTPHNKAGEEHEGIGTKIKKLFRRGSGGQDQHHDSTTAAHDPNAEVGDTTSQGTATTATAVDRVIDQTPQGDMLPTAQANAAGATNANASAETGWPGVINGQHLAAIVVDLHSVDKSRVTLGGGKKNEGSTVTVHVSGIGHPGLERVGVNHHESPKSGVIKFEFDKDWIGAKGEAELLQHYIVTACENLPERHDNNGSGFNGERPFPQAENFQLGSGNSHAQTGQPNLPTANVGLGQEVGPDGRIVA